MSEHLNVDELKEMIVNIEGLDETEVDSLKRDLERLDIEDQILAVTGFVPEKKYRDRQKYLEVLLRQVVDLSDTKYEILPDDAAEWSIRSARLHKSGKPIPDFANTNGVDHEDEIHESANEVELAADNGTDENDVQGESSPQAEKKEKKAPGKKRGPKAKAKVKIAKPKKEPKAKASKAPSRGTNQWGVVNGTKSDIVCRMLAQEGGTTMKDIIQATGQAHYNLVNRLQRRGWKIEKDGLNIRMVGKVDD